MAMDRMLLVGGHWILRQGIRQSLKRFGLTIAGDGDYVGDAWSDSPGVERPDVVLAIAGHAGQFGSALETAYEAKRRFADAKLAIWGEAALVKDVSAAIRAGADALLTSTLSSRLLGNSLQLVLLSRLARPVTQMACGLARPRKPAWFSSVRKPPKVCLGHKLFPTLPVQGSSEEQEVLNEPAPALPVPPSPSADPADHLPAATSCIIRLEDHAAPEQIRSCPFPYNDTASRLRPFEDCASWRLMRRTFAPAA